jgi:hypothetical protein
VNGRSTPNFDTFLQVISSLEDRHIRLRVLGLEDKVKVITMQPDYNYWETILFEEVPNHSSWKLTAIDTGHPKESSTIAPAPITTTTTTSGSML